MPPFPRIHLPKHRIEKVKQMAISILSVMGAFFLYLKTDMDVERFPSGKFDTNELVLELTVLAYNILRVIGQKSLKSSSAPKTKRKVKRRRIRTVISNLILIAGHVKELARRLILSLGKSNIWIPVFMDLHHQLVLT